MAKLYKNTRPNRYKERRSTSILSILLAFLGGYWIATIFDYNKLSQILNSPVLSILKGSHIATHIAQAPKPLPKPKFEFYTLLTDEHGKDGAIQNTKATVAAASSTPVPTHAPVSEPNISVISHQIIAKSSVPVAQETIAVNVKPKVINAVKVESTAPKGNYWLQVAAFKNRSDAANMKAGLVLRGFDVTITGTTGAANGWYRVMIGPFASLDSVKNIQVGLASRTHMHGMIRQMDV